MERAIRNISLNRRDFVKHSLKAGLVLTTAPSLVFKPRALYAESILDIEPPSVKPNGDKTWRLFSHLGRDELERFEMDLSPWEKTPRHEKYPYVAAKLEPPYTASEIVYMLTVGQYFPWWSHECPMGGMMISNRGGINYYTGQREAWSALTPDTLEDFLYKWAEDKIYLWVLDRFFTPVRTKCSKLLQNAYRTGANFKKYSDKWEFSNFSQKTAPVGKSLYSDKYWSRDYTYGDTMMVPWYYTWRYLGTDVLYEADAVRFPKTRKNIKIRGWDGIPEQHSTSTVKLMGDDYPAYTDNGGVPCYVIEGRTNSDFFTTEHKRVILWVDMHACRELRRERYDLENNLVAINETRNRLELKNKGKWGYSILIHLAWDLKRDHMSVNHYDFHRYPETFKVDPHNPEQYFRPNPIAMCSEMFPVPLSTMVFRDPEQFYLRPKLMADKFPNNRKIHISDQILKLVKAQNKADQLVFL